MKKILPFLSIFLLISLGIAVTQIQSNSTDSTLADVPKPAYWFMLHRKSNIEYLYLGKPGNLEESELIRKFDVKTGIPGERPTPLPELVGREYWVLTDKKATTSYETAPYFLTLDIPVPSVAPFGPTPYLECGGEQCNWQVPGAFGLHGVAGIPERLSVDDSGSSGCIRHSDEDITYLYELLNPKAGEIRYYVKDL